MAFNPRSRLPKRVPVYLIPEPEKIEHSPGWPHMGKAGNCLCLKHCCFGPSGCRCRSCAHKNHGGPLTETQETAKV